MPTRTSNQASQASVSAAPAAPDRAAQLYLQSLQATLPQKVAAAAAPSQIQRIRAFDETVGSRKRMSAEYMKAFQEGRILPREPLTVNSVKYVDIVTGKVTQIRTMFFWLVFCSG